MQPRFDNLTDLELKVIVNILSYTGKMWLCDFINLCRFQPLPFIKNIGKKLRDANSELIIFSVFSMN